MAIEETDFFETHSPPSFTFYAEIFKSGRFLGRLDVVTRIEIRGTELWFTDCHIHGLSPGALGRDGLNALARAVMEDNDVKTLVIEGGTRTTGVRPGHTPKRMRFLGRLGVEDEGR
ncbi:MAG: hypothetical protein HQL38_06010 [Alphaproteobacteria bacterium]|nr:hypothetical protein [Alphaproteobacteria bacterium]